MNTTQQQTNEKQTFLPELNDVLRLFNKYHFAKQNQTSKPLVNNYKEIQEQFALAGNIMSDEEAIRYYNAIKFSYQKPAKLTGFGSKKYNKIFDDAYKDTVRRIAQLRDIILNKRAKLETLRKESFGVDQPKYERLDNFINRINHINEKDNDFEDKILQCLVNINDDDLLYVYALLSLNESPEETMLTGEEPTIWDRIGDSFENGVDKVSDLICAPFNWMTDKLMDLTFR